MLLSQNQNLQREMVEFWKRYGIQIPVNPPPPPVPTGDPAALVIVFCLVGLTLVFFAIFLSQRFKVDPAEYPVIPEEPAAPAPDPPPAIRPDPPPPPASHKMATWFQENPCRAVTIAGIVLVMLMSLCPPWTWHSYHIEIDRNGFIDHTGFYRQQQQQVKYYYETSAGYYWLFSPPRGSVDQDEYNPRNKIANTPAIDWGRLILQYLAVLLAGGGAYYFFGKRSRA